VQTIKTALSQGLREWQNPACKMAILTGRTHFSTNQKNSGAQVHSFTALILKIVGVGYN
jgi:hypothetical protein